MKLRLSEHILESRRTETKELRRELEKALKKDRGEYGDNVERVVDKWMEKPNTVLDASDIDFIIDDLMM